MRCLGEINGREHAERFVAHLLTLDISTQIESQPKDPETWEIWVRDEDKLSTAREKLEEFQADPTNSRYSEALKRAAEILEEREKARIEAVKNVRRVEMRSQPRGLMGGGPTPPLTLALLIVCIVIAFISNFGRPGPGNNWGRTIMEELRFVSETDYIESNMDPAASLKRGEIWRAITPTFLHLSMLHLAMNMYFLFTFGRLVERWIGTPRFAVMVLALAILPNLLQGLSPEWMRGNPFFGGISGVVYGLFAYVWVRTSLNPSHGISIPFPMVVIMVGLIVVGLSGAVPGWYMADLCHLGGFLTGAALAFASEQRSL